MTRDEVVSHYTGEIVRALIDLDIRPSVAGYRRSEGKRIESEGWSQAESAIADIVGLSIDDLSCVSDADLLNELLGRGRKALAAGKPFPGFMKPEAK